MKKRKTLIILILFAGLFIAVLNQKQASEIGQGTSRLSNSETEKNVKMYKKASKILKKIKLLKTFVFYKDK